MHYSTSPDDIEKIDLKLPTLPGIALELLETVSGDHPDVKRAAAIIATDAPLSAKVLRTVNSPLYGMRSKVSTVSQAMLLLGTNAVKNLAMSFSLIANFRPPKRCCFTYAQFWKDSLLGAVAARAISAGLKTEFPEEAFFCGLMQNIGSLILAESFPKEYQGVEEDIQHASSSVQQAEMKIFGLDHTRVGEYAVRKWGLPGSFEAPIRFHHEPDMLGYVSSKESLQTQILHLSSLYIEVFKDRESGPALATVNQYLDRRGYAASIEPFEIARKIADEVKSVFPLFDVEVDAGELLRISESAKNHLHELSTELVATVRTQVQDIEHLKLHSATDGLTTLYNRRHFIKTLTHEIERANRHGSALSLLMIDIDEFKAVNDFYGHLAGDYALQIVAARLKEALRGSDYLARYGGEEFAAILPSTSRAEAFHVAERLRKTIRATPVSHNGRMFSVTASFGIASMDLHSDVDMEGFIQMADEALYEAKNSGRDRCCSYDKASFDQTKPAILVVDDEDVVLVTLSKMLERLGYGVIAAKNGNEAMRLFDLHADRIGTVILDVMMPGVSAAEILPQLRERCPGTRVFLSSGYTSDHIDKDLMANCEGFLAKPYTIGELSEKILGGSIPN